MRIVALGAALAAMAISLGCSGGGDDGAGYRGFVSVDREHDPTFGDTFGASAVWLSVNLPLNISPFEQADGECMEYPAGGTIGNFTVLDAGTSLLLDGPNGDLTLTDAFGFGYAASVDSSGYFVGGGTYTLSGTGGADISAFSIPLTAPAAITAVTAPNISSGSFNLPRSADLTLAWSPAGTGRVLVSVDQYDGNTDDLIASVVCRFDNDGSGVIPAARFANFSTDTLHYTDFSLDAMNATTVDVPGAGSTIVIFTDSWSAEPVIQ